MAFNPETAPPDDVKYFTVRVIDPRSYANQSIQNTIVAILAGVVVLIGAVFVVWVLSLSAARRAHAHSWYPIECCNGQDCHPIACDSITETKEGHVWHGLLFEEAKVKASKDGQCHVCAGEEQQEDGTSVPKYPRCLFIKPSS